jgi:RNAse (barnase) inhibitor barstar
MVKNITISLKEISIPSELFHLFSHTFSFPAYFGYNWDALYDMMQALDVWAPVFLHCENPITGVHLILENFDHIQEVFTENDLIRLYSILVDLSVSPEYRADHLRFTFEIQYS